MRSPTRHAWRHCAEHSVLTPFVGMTLVGAVGGVLYTGGDDYGHGLPAGRCAGSLGHYSASGCAGVPPRRAAGMSMTAHLISDVYPAFHLQLLWFFAGPRPPEASLIAARRTCAWARAGAHRGHLHPALFGMLRGCCTQNLGFMFVRVEEASWLCVGRAALSSRYSRAVSGPSPMRAIRQP